VGGVVGGVLDHPRLQGVAASLVAEENGLRVHVRAARPGRRELEPRLARRVPKDAAVYAGLAGLDAFGPLLERLGALAEEGAGLDLDRDLLAPLAGEVAVSVSPRLPVPVVTIVARTSDERRTRESLARMQPPLAEALTGSTASRFEQRDVLGKDAFALRVSTGFELIYAVWDGHVAISTAQPGLEQAIEPEGDVTEAEHFGATVGELPDKVEALAFTDLSELLALAEQTGLAGNPGFDAVRDDLRRVRAAGAIVRREDPDTTAELFFEIP
jgi:hypothetical protein